MAEVGRPSMYDSNEQLEKAVESYFEYIKGSFGYDTDPEDKSKDVKVWERYPENASITGLALFLGFESRQSIYDYEKNGEFSYTIKRARLRVEAAYEQALLSKAATGAIFALKNFGWTDSQAVDHTTKGESLNKAQDLSKLSDEELRVMTTIQKKINAE